MKNLAISIIIVLIYASIGFYLLNRFDEARAEVKRQTALVNAQIKLNEAQTKSEIKRLQALTELEKVKVRSDPEVAESIRQAEKTKVWLAAWFPVYFPMIVFAGSGVLLATYISFRLVDFQFDGMTTKARALDVPRLSRECLQVKALEAT